MKICWSNKTLGAVARAVAASGCALAVAAPAQADDLKLSGFASIVAGKTSGRCVPVDSLADKYNEACTRYVANWGTGAVYTDDLALNRETRAGVQADYSFNRQWSATAQVTARTLKDQHVNLEWAYLTWSPTPEWKLQVGRKRLPLYYYSDFQDVGFAYNTIRPSPDVYGWDVVNYNGASLSTTRSLGDWSLRAEAYAGAEKSRDNPYSTLFGPDPVEVKWSGVTGLSLEMSKDWFTGRISYTRTKFQAKDQTTGDQAVLFDGSTKASQDFLGLVFNGDWDEWQLRSEFGKAKRMNAVGYDADFHLITLGRQFGGFTVTAGLSGYKEKTRFDANTYVPVKLDTRTLALRYDVHKGGALKFQIDQVKDKTVPAFSGKARVLSVAYDVVF